MYWTADLSVSTFDIFLDLAPFGTCCLSVWNPWLTCLTRFLSRSLRRATAGGAPPFSRERFGVGVDVALKELSLEVDSWRWRFGAILLWEVVVLAVVVVVPEEVRI